MLRRQTRAVFKFQPELARMVGLNCNANEKSEKSKELLFQNFRPGWTGADFPWPLLAVGNDIFS